MGNLLGIVQDAMDELAERNLNLGRRQSDAAGVARFAHEDIGDVVSIPPATLNRMVGGETFALIIENDACEGA